MTLSRAINRVPAGDSGIFRGRRRMLGGGGAVVISAKFDSTLVKFDSSTVTWDKAI